MREMKWAKKGPGKGDEQLYPPLLPPLASSPTAASLLSDEAGVDVPFVLRGVPVALGRVLESGRLFLLRRSVVAPAATTAAPLLTLHLDW